MTLTLPLMVACGKSEKQYDDELRQGYVMMMKTMLGNAALNDVVCNTWSKAIFDKVTPSGRYCDDFNEALEELIDSLDAHEIREYIQSTNDSMLLYANRLKDPPTSRKNCYDDFVDMVSDVSTLTRNATKISGSLSDYRSNNHELFDKIAKKNDQFKIKYGDILPKEDK